MKGALLAALVGAAACSRGVPDQRSGAERAASSTSASVSPAASSAAAATVRPGAAPSGPVPVEPARSQPERPYNVLLIMIDSLRADMPWTGYPRQIAPWLSAFAGKSVLYPRSYSLSSYTAKSVVPALAGRYPSEMARDGLFFTRWGADNVLITERLQAAGHRTLAGNGHGYFLPGMGVDQGFSEYRLLPGTFLDTKGVFDVTSERLTGLAKEILSKPENVEQTGQRRFFAYFHYLDPHYQYFDHADVPDFGKKRRDLYDKEVYFTDRWVGDLVDWALAQPWGERTVVIITADHGEGFGENGQYRHAYELWEPLIRVPLFVHIPGVAARRIEVARGQIDLAPTIADLMGLPAEAAAEPLPAHRGRSLVPELFGAEAVERPVIADLPRCDLMDRRRALMLGDYKLLAFGDDSSFRLYDVAHDFVEAEDLAKTQPERLASMKALYAEISATIPTVPVVGSAPLKGAPPGRRW